MELQDDSIALEEALNTASGMVRDLSLSRIGNEIHTLEVREEDGNEILKIEIHAARLR